MSENLQGLYRDAMKAMKAGDNETARNLLLQVVEEDEENVEAWIALSKVVDNDAEKRICLTTILQLDPTNAYARNELAKSEDKIEHGQEDEELYPGISRKMVRTAAIGAGIYILVVFVITFLIVSLINNGKNSERASLTKIASDATGTLNAFATNEANITATAVQFAVSATERAQLLITPSPTFTWTPDPRFPTWTPTPTEGSANFRVLDLPPANIPGVIWGWGGRDATESGFLDPFRLSANGSGQKREVVNEYASNLTVNIPGERVLFERYDRRSGETALVTLNPNQPEDTLTSFPALWAEAGIIDIRHPSVSADGSQFVVDALVTGTNVREIFLVNTVTETIVQLTNDSANYTTPAITQDGLKVLAVRQDPTNGTDLVLIDPITQNQILMTNDGDTLIESQPSWHRDGLQAVYRAYPNGQPNSGEIYLLRVLVESGTSSLLIATADDEAYPVFDPTGLFIAFANNRTQGIYNIYIFELSTLTTYQLTADEFNHYPGGWSLQ